MFLMGIFWYHLYDMSNYKLCNLDTYNHNFGSSVELADQNYNVTSNRYKNDLALLTDMLDASNMKLSADLGLVNARINLIYSYYKMKYITHTL